MASITASCGPDGRCQVFVEFSEGPHGGRTFRYTVAVPPELTGKLGAEPAAVARATLAFLLDREPPTAIMREFDPDVVRGYFPEYDEKLPGYLTA